MGMWQEPKDGKRWYLVRDNSEMNDFFQHIQDADIGSFYTMSGRSRVNLGAHIFNGTLYSSNYVGVCRLRNTDGECLHDTEGNELILQVIPRFEGGVAGVLNYIRTDDEFDRYLAPQTARIGLRDREIEAAEQNELFYFYSGEAPLKVDDEYSDECGIVTVTAFLGALTDLCKRPLMGKMLREESNLTGKIKGRVSVEKNIRKNTLYGRNDRFFCQYPVFSTDILENQIFKAALDKARRYINSFFGVRSRANNNYVRMIMLCSNALKNISDVQLSGADCRRTRFGGCYSYYRPVTDLARMVLDNITIESEGEARTTGYIVPYAISMEKLFEVYVRTYLKNNGIHSYMNRNGSDIVLEKFDEKMEVLSADNPEADADYISGSVKPDIVLTETATDRKIVLDVKYKNYDRSNSRNDRLQLLAYSMIYSANNIGLIFPTNSDDRIFVPRRVNTVGNREVRYHQFAMKILTTSSSMADYIKNLPYQDTAETEI